MKRLVQEKISVYPSMYYSLFPPRPPPQMHTSILLWIVGLEKRNQPVDSALNNKARSVQTVWWKLVESPQFLYLFSFFFGDCQGRKITSKPESLVKVLI